MERQYSSIERCGEGTHLWINGKRLTAFPYRCKLWGCRKGCHELKLKELKEELHDTEWLVYLEVRKKGYNQSNDVIRAIEHRWQMKHGDIYYKSVTNGRYALLINKPLAVDCLRELFGKNFIMAWELYSYGGPVSSKNMSKAIDLFCSRIPHKPGRWITGSHKKAKSVAGSDNSYIGIKELNDQKSEVITVQASFSDVVPNLEKLGLEPIFIKPHSGIAIFKLPLNFNTDHFLTKLQWKITVRKDKRRLKIMHQLLKGELA